MTIREMLQEAVTAFTAADLTSPRLDAEVLLSHCLGKERLFFHTHPNDNLHPGDIERCRQFLDRRLQREPVAYIVGCKEFWSMTFNVDRRVLIPRPETEILVEEVLKIAALSDNIAPAILEVGVGSGAISIALASELAQAKMVSSDISVEAIRVAGRNAEKFGLTGRIAFVAGDMVKPFFGPFDIIVSNPPYIAEEDYSGLPIDVRDFEPSSALLGGRGGSAYHRELIYDGGPLLKKGGWLVVEIGAEQKKDVEKMMKDSGLYDEIRSRRDYGGQDRVALARRG